MSTLSYNGVEIDLTRTLYVSHTPVRAEDGSYLYTRLAIRVIGVINPGKITTPGAGVGALIADTVGSQQGATAVIQGIRHRLLQPRGDLRYSIGDGATATITSPPAGLTCDADNGPTPMDLTITAVQGSKTLICTYEIATSLVECPGATLGDPQALLQNVYSQSHSIDANFYTTLVTNGRATFNTSILELQHVQPDHYRDILFPPVPRGFRRMAIDITGTPSRNVLTYSIVDREQCFDLGETGPTGSNTNVTGINAEYCVGSTGQAGAPVSLMTAHSMRVRVDGSKAASPWTLVKVAVKVMQTKLPIGDPSRGYLQNIRIVQSLTARHVSLDATMILNQAAGGGIPGIDATKLREDNVFANQNGLNPSPPNRKGTAGTYANELFSSAWKSACAAPPAPEEGDYPADPITPNYSNNTGPIVTTTVTEDLPDYTPQYSESQSSSYPYSEYRINSQLQTKTGIRQAAIAGKAGSEGYQSGGGSSGGSGDESTSDEDKPTSVFLTLSRPTQRKVVEWSVTRIGKAPAIPDSEPNDPNCVLVDDGYVQLAEPRLLADGCSYAFTVMGRYVYGLKRPLKKSETLAFPNPPWLSSSFGQFALTSDDVAGGIIDEASSESDGGTSPGSTPTP